MDNNAFVEEFKRLTIENEKLKQEIKEIRISKNNEIDEVEQLYTKTKQELDEKTKILDQIYTEKIKNNNYTIIKELSEITNFKKSTRI